MNWTIEYNDAVRKQPKEVDTATRKRIRSFLHERLIKLDDPRQIGSTLQGAELGRFWRYRVGDYRIVCDIQDGRLVVLVIEIGHRSSIYR